MFNITRGKGFHMEFENGYVISVQWGSGNYCDNKHLAWDAEVGPCKTAEIAIWPKGGDLKEWEHGDSVKGWCDAEEVAYWIYQASTWKAGEAPEILTYKK